METIYLDYLPNELLLIIIEYLDNDREKGKLYSEVLEVLLKDFINISDRYHKIYQDYIQFVKIGLINPFINIDFNCILKSHVNSKFIVSYLEEYFFNSKLSTILSNLSTEFTLQYKVNLINSKIYHIFLYRKINNKYKLKTIIFLNNEYYLVKCVDNIRSCKFSINKYSNWINVIKNIDKDYLNILFETHGYNQSFIK